MLILERPQASEVFKISEAFLFWQDANLWPTLRHGLASKFHRSARTYFQWNFHDFKNGSFLLANFKIG